mmetsp:Transcript_6300/g.9274  ORF Transcript_6300/g.9274 Transcript_6300/m.9274 type:complete len:84 (-) Transcript_6300:860-1111(-)
MKKYPSMRKEQLFVLSFQAPFNLFLPLYQLRKHQRQPTTKNHHNGSYRCAYKSGWRDADNNAFPGSNCININECLENIHNCDS